MNEIYDDGGSAFPVSNNSTHGMSLRDYFAAKAMQGILANSMLNYSQTSYKAVALDAYVIADEMLKERDREEES